MDPDAVACPALVGGPLRLSPFRALMLAPGRIGARVSGGAFARPYRDVAERLRRWESTGAVIADEAPALYLHEYTAAGVTVRGLVGVLDLTRTATGLGDAAVLPHEGVHPAQVGELADRMAEMTLNPAPILLTQDAPADLRGILRGVRSREPQRQFTDRSGQFHRIWAIRDPDELESAAGALAPTRALIADGHHRYAAYLQLRRRGLGTAVDTGLAMVVDQGDTPLFLGAIHRVLVGLALDDVLTLPGLVSARRTGPQEAVGALGPSTLAVTDGRAWATAELPVDGEHAAVELLHARLLPDLHRGPRSIGYVHSVDEALRAVARRRGVAVLMPAPAFDDVLRIARHGRLLPEKATSFQPKPSVGVLIRSLRDAGPDPS